MSRINFDKVQSAINMATQAAVKKLAEERTLDTEHLEEHAKQSRDMLAHLTEQENHIVEYMSNYHNTMINGLKDMFAGLRAEEQKRLASLEAHVQDLKDDGGGVPIKYVEMKQITGE